MARPAEYQKVVDFLEGLGFVPGEVESVHIDPNYISIVGFTLKDTDDGGKSKVIAPSGEAQRFVKQFPMHTTEEN